MPACGSGGPARPVPSPTGCHQGGRVEKIQSGARRRVDLAILSSRLPPPGLYGPDCRWRSFYRVMQPPVMTAFRGLPSMSPSHPARRRCREWIRRCDSDTLSAAPARRVPVTAISSKTVHAASHRRPDFGLGCGPDCRRSAVTLPRWPAPRARVPRGVARVVRLPPRLPARAGRLPARAGRLAWPHRGLLT